MQDSAFAKEFERMRRETEERVKEVLFQAIGALASTVEKKDPHTAGHQRRVAQLSVAIAELLGLPSSQIDGIKLGAMIHDIGKLHVPTEILTKPGKLTEPELAIVRTHPIEGYEIVKDVEFPWPVHHIILQHHERLDGSGYPYGLTGEDIVLEAKIVGIADVVESITFHRPYREALGLEAAISEIQKGKGVLFEAEIVDACVALFRERRFKFNGEREDYFL